MSTLVIGDVWTLNRLHPWRCRVEVPNVYCHNHDIKINHHHHPQSAWLTKRCLPLTHIEGVEIGQSRLGHGNFYLGLTFRAQEDPLPSVANTFEADLYITISVPMAKSSYVAKHRLRIEEVLWSSSGKHNQVASGITAERCEEFSTETLSTAVHETQSLLPSF